MKVFKFGGASVKDAPAVRNVAALIKAQAGEKMIVVISAMGKTTNSLERIASHILERKKDAFRHELTELMHFHEQIVCELFDTQTHMDSLNEIFRYIQDAYDLPTHKNDPACFVDQIISLGEKLSTDIITTYLQKCSISACLIHADTVIHTDTNFGQATIDWEQSQLSIRVQLSKLFVDFDVVVTQGFIGGTHDNGTFYRTTLGREGSDFSASIFAYCMDAQNVTIWKDVDGMFNADPKQFPDAVKLDKISYNEATELAYYGASVIHPKTLKPLQNKNIPLFIKSFIEPRASGTIIQHSTNYDRLVPSFIIKSDQVLISFRSRTFSFIAESHLSDIFNKLSKLGVQINSMQNSALSFSILVDALKINLPHLLSTFQQDYEVRYNTNLQLITVRHHTPELIDQLTANKTILLQQYARETARMIVEL